MGAPRNETDLTFEGLHELETMIMKEEKLVFLTEGGGSGDRFY